MKKFILIILIFFFGMICSAGCTNNPGQNFPQTDQIKLTNTIHNKTLIAGDNMHLTMKEKFDLLQKEIDTGFPIHLKIGDAYEVILEENPTTGFSWNATITNGLRIIDDRFVSDENQDQMKGGAGGEHYWKLKAFSQGNQTFSATYHRPWEPLSDVNPSYNLRFLVIDE